MYQLHTPSHQIQELRVPILKFKRNHKKSLGRFSRHTARRPTATPMTITPQPSSAGTPTMMLSSVEIWFLQIKETPTMMLSSARCFSSNQRNTNQLRCYFLLKSVFHQIHYHTIKLARNVGVFILYPTPRILQDLVHRQACSSQFQYLSSSTKMKTNTETEMLSSSHSRTRPRSAPSPTSPPRGRGRSSERCHMPRPPWSASWWSL